MGGRKGNSEDRPRGLDLGQLAYFVGAAANEAVLGRMRGEGFAGLRRSHAELVQHLAPGPRAIGELAELLGATPRTAAKRIAELRDGGYVEDVPGEGDVPARSVRLSERGQACVAAARAARRSLEGDLREAIGDGAVTSAKKVLVRVLEQLGGPPTGSRRPRRAAR